MIQATFKFIERCPTSFDASLALQVRF